MKEHLGQQVHLNLLDPSAVGGSAAHINKVFDNFELFWKMELFQIIQKSFSHINEDLLHNMNMNCQIA